MLGVRGRAGYEILLRGYGDVLAGFGGEENERALVLREQLPRLRLCCRQRSPSRLQRLHSCLAQLRSGRNMTGWGG